MSILTMSAPSPYHTFENELPWDMHRPASDPSRPRIESKQTALPSIRQTFPDLHLEGSLANVAAGPPPTSYYRPSPPPNAGPSTLPGYVHSPSENKKRSVSNEMGHESLRVTQVPRLYCSEDPSRRVVSPPYRDQPPLPARDYWGGSSEYGTGSSAPLPPVEMASHSGPHPDCSSPPSTLRSDRDVRAMSRPREHGPEMVNMPMASEFGRGTPVLMDRLSPQARNQEYGYSYHHPSRYQSLSTSSIQPHDRTTFSPGAAAYGSHYQDMGRYIDMGSSGDSKQRKRRGNLPKETTDKLRAWFVEHLQHPYPTEDEKQDLMRQTGLQMNQISNWFINARRRQLPTMISNARAETDVMSTRSHHDRRSVLKSTEHAPEYGSRRDDGFPLSDSEGGAYEDDIHPLHQRRGGNMDRESV
ncbi:hypothetical protein E4U43_008458 [Claviceps pusilla]|uniref:Homeobox domain-containing protein n=1 Tax=Claviceps pusilla TaxID=123648 RepID=A0A9P7SY94_9HYPO|nr:hypothetical protein E4U43_008458 [Claviceps pusilla]